MKLIFHVIVNACPLRAESLEAVGVSPDGEWSFLLHVDEAVFLDILMAGVPFDSEGPEVESELRDHSLLNHAPRKGLHPQWWWREETKRGRGTVKVTNNLDGSRDVEVGAKVFDTEVLGPGRDSAKCCSQRRRPKCAPNGQGAFFGGR